ncbi:uncharacterized protein LOC119310537 isoform X1 [Triticum dicoccoides]|uniref:uncharacterized protein LOC119310537 isoform X1 n=1 Tax=Triticum dicoccoides TaxID=85692 RepID=UPI001890CDB2|nr:uncharacterized protein LOC119310537 isoform X1 [Triticum dicoccoides]
MTKLLDFKPHKPDNMQSYICVKSLIRLDVYKKAGIVRRPKQRGVWELKKWEVWEHKLSENERIWTDTHRDEHVGAAHAQCYHTMINDVLPRILDDTIQLEIGMEINQIFPNIPDQQPRPLRRLNCVSQKQDMENLFVRMENWNNITKATREARHSIFSMMVNAVLNQIGASSSDAGISSQNRSEGDDVKI